MHKKSKEESLRSKRRERARSCYSGDWVFTVDTDMVPPDGFAGSGANSYVAGDG